MAEKFITLSQAVVKIDYEYRSGMPPHIAKGKPGDEPLSLRPAVQGITFLREAYPAEALVLSAHDASLLQRGIEEVHNLPTEQSTIADYFWE